MRRDVRSVGLENWLRDDGGRVGIRTIEDLICEQEEDSWLPVARRNCRSGMFVHGGGQHWWEKLLWQFTVAIKSDPVALESETWDSDQFRTAKN